MLGHLQLISNESSLSGLITLIAGQFNSVGEFLLGVDLTVSTTVAMSYLTVVTRKSTLPDPETSEVPADEVIFRSRHVQRRFWNTTTCWTQNKSSGIYSWTSTSPMQTASDNLHYYHPFVRPATWSSSSSSPLDATPSTLAVDRYAPNDVARIVQPETYFVVCKLTSGQSLSIETKCYVDDPYLDDATTPYLDDNVPVNNVPSNSEVEATFSGMLSAWLLRI